MPLPLPILLFASTVALAGVNETLDRIERTGAELTTFASDLVYERYRALEDEIEQRKGKVALQTTTTVKTVTVDFLGVALPFHFQARDRKFAILFSFFMDASGNETVASDHFIYDSGWLLEIDSRNKSFVKRQIVAPGKTFDPLKLGEGPIPLPFGQSKAEVLAHFSVVECPAPTSPLLKTLKNVVGLTLTPKPGTALAEEAKSLDVFYDATTFALRGVDILKEGGDRTMILLLTATMNERLSDEQRQLLEIPQLDPREWQMDIRPWQPAQR